MSSFEPYLFLACAMVRHSDAWLERRTTAHGAAGGGGAGVSSDGAELLFVRNYLR
jgi:hypothetical protein